MTDELYAELRLRVGVQEGKQLLRLIGFPSYRIPLTVDPTEFWLDVRAAFDSGLELPGLPGASGELRLVTVLVREYSGNRVFRQAEAGLAAGAAATAVGRATGLRVLFLAADPPGPARPRIRVYPEGRLIQDIAGQRSERPMEVRLRAAARPADLIPELLANRPDLLHLGGHGSPNGYFMFEREDGHVAPVAVDELAKVLDAVGGVGTLLLTACFLGQERWLEVLRAHVSAVVGCRVPVADPTVLSFDQGFYTGLLHGEDIGRCFALGVAQCGMDHLDSSGWRMELGYRQVRGGLG